ncbi:CRP-like cAMP-binding protein [Sphingobacterium allocomposti]|jgi:CRP-like cAMP-binding protein|uniref:CRP-like cAMP-binding protein n=2 Tax=Sphingobacterium allocomposti TaxID=415956 RepID=A0A5S5DS00_9SPHI|nr:CRP-like cAMP-binding protein [Sphingobacterium composti Yoo et al. 2007 non Ten et al. 2007]
MGWERPYVEAMDVISIINRITALPPDDRDKLAGLFQEVTVDKNEYIIEAEKVANFVYFIGSGSCRIFYHKVEKEVILDFAFPGDALLSLNSYVHGKAGYETIQTLERCVLYKVEVRALLTLFANSIAIANWGRKLAELETLKIESRLMSKLFKTATESYQELLARAPGMVATIKLGFIASYLGISQVTLSRIRSKI